MTVGHGLLAFVAGVGIFLAALFHSGAHDKAEQAVQSLEQQRAYQIINIKEHEVTCFKFDNGVDCIPDYQLNTRKKYEG